MVNIVLSAVSTRVSSFPLGKSKLELYLSSNFIVNFFLNEGWRQFAMIVTRGTSSQYFRNFSLMASTIGERGEPMLELPRLFSTSSYLNINYKLVSIE